MSAASSSVRKLPLRSLQQTHRDIDENKRPELPEGTRWGVALGEIIRQCWAASPTLRPSFATLHTLLFTLRMQFGWTGIDEVESGEEEDEQDWIDWIDELDREVKSPPLRPDMPLPALPRECS